MHTYVDMDRSLHEAARVDVIIVEEVANFVVAALGGEKDAVLVAGVVAVAPVVVALLVLGGHVLKVVVGGGEVERRVRVRPELRPLPRPPHRLQHLVPVHISQHRHLL